MPQAVSYKLQRVAMAPDTGAKTGRSSIERRKLGDLPNDRLRRRSWPAGLFCLAVCNPAKSKVVGVELSLPSGPGVTQLASTSAKGPAEEGLTEARQR